MEAKVAVSTVIYKLTKGGEELLVLKRSDNGQWNFPGGKVEPPENLAEAASREVLEETGLEVNPHRIISVFSNGTDDGGTFVFVMFETNVYRFGKVKLNREHTEYRWVTRQQLVDEIAPHALPRLKAYSMSDRGAMSGIYHRDPTEYTWYPGEYAKIGKAKHGDRRAEDQGSH